MTRILYITDVFPPHCGGSGWSVYFFARALRNQGLDVKIVSLDGPEREYDGFMVETFPLARSGVPFLANYIRENQDLPKIAQRLKQLSDKADILHAHHRFSAVALAQSEPSRFFATIRDYWPICFCSRSIYRTGATCNLRDFTHCSSAEHKWKAIAAPLLYHWFDTRLHRWNTMMRKAEKIFCISNHLKQQLLSVFNEDQLSVLPNFAEEIPATEDVDLPDKFIVYIGRLERNKGAHLLPQIMEKSGVQLPLVLVGEGKLDQNLEKHFRARSIHTDFMGYLQYPQMLSVLKKCEFVLFPSIWPEPLGRVLIEAGMLRKAAITFNHPGGHHDIVEHKISGLMADNVDEFAASITRLAEHSSLRDELGENARKIYESRFSPQSVIPQLLRHYSI